MVNYSCYNQKAIIYFYIKGNKLFAEKRFEEAIKEYTSAIVTPKKH